MYGILKLSTRGKIPFFFIFRNLIELNNYLYINKKLRTVNIETLGSVKDDVSVRLYYRK